MRDGLIRDSALRKDVLRVLASLREEKNLLHRRQRRSRSHLLADSIGDFRCDVGRVLEELLRHVASLPKLRAVQQHPGAFFIDHTDIDTQVENAAFARDAFVV